MARNLSLQICLFLSCWSRVRWNPFPANWICGQSTSNCTRVFLSCRVKQTDPFHLQILWHMQRSWEIRQRCFTQIQTGKLKCTKRRSCSCYFLLCIPAGVNRWFFQAGETQGHLLTYWWAGAKINFEHLPAQPRWVNGPATLLEKAVFHLAPYRNFKAVQVSCYPFNHHNNPER